MASHNGATWHGLAQLGAVAPGYQADLLVLLDLERFEPEVVLKRGRPVGEFNRPEVPSGSSTRFESHPRHPRTSRSVRREGETRA